jgi:hypothetical protein
MLVMGASQSTGLEEHCKRHAMSYLKFGFYVSELVDQVDLAGRVLLLTS